MEKKNRISLKAEWIALSLCTLLHAWFFSRILSGQATLTYDNIYWNYATFQQHFRELSSGHIPIFNYLSRFGELYLPESSFWDPFQTLIGLFFWKVTDNKLLSFNLFRYTLAMIPCLGVYFCFRTKCETVALRALLWFCIITSSFFANQFLLDLQLHAVLWAPWILYIFREQFILRKAGVLSCLTLAVLIGSTFQFYYFIFPCVFLFLYFGLALFFGVPVASFSPWKAGLLRILLVMVAIFPMGFYNLTSYIESKNWTFPPRTQQYFHKGYFFFDPYRLNQALKNPGEINLDAKAVNNQGSHQNLWDYAEMFNPEGNYFAGVNPIHGSSEAFLVLSLLTIAFGITGLIIFNNREGYIWLNLLVIYIILALGKNALVYPYLINVMPIFGFVRHTIGFSPYVQFTFFYFFVIGGNYAIRRLTEGLEVIRS